MESLREQFGEIDADLFDLLRRGRVAAGATVLDAGCDEGRNLVYFLRAGHPVCAVDERPQAIAALRDLAARLAPSLPPSNFRCERVDATSFDAGCADLVISSGVMSAARDHAHFQALLAGTWRLVRAGGLLFCRLASTIGLTDSPHPLGDGRFRRADGTDRYLVDEAQLLDVTAAIGGELLDPLKTTLVRGEGSTTTWIIRRRAAAGVGEPGSGVEATKVARQAKERALREAVAAAATDPDRRPVRAVITQFVELQGKYYPPETPVWITEGTADTITISSRDGREGQVAWEAAELAPRLPAVPDNLPRAPAGQYRVIGQDSFSHEDPAYRLGDFATLEEARAAVAKAEDSQRGAGDLADHLVIYDEWGRVVR